MEKKYENGERVYLEVTVNEVNPGNGYDYTVLWKDHVDGAMCMASVGEENLCSMESGIDWQGAFNEYSEKAQRRIKALTKQLEEANETIRAFSESENIVRTNFDAKVDENKELKSRNAELEALLKEVMATRDEAIKQNNELIADRNNWKEASQRYHDNAKVADKATEELRKENKDLKAKAAENANTISRLSANKVALTEEVGRLRETIADRTKDVNHYNEENDKLKTDVADLRAELESAREALEQNGKDRDFYHARFDEAAENLHKALTENAELKSRNEHLETLLKTKPIEEPTKTVHAVLNDGTGYNFLKCTKASFDNYADFSVLKIYRGEEYVAGFLRGDKPGNLAYWWTE